MQETKAADVRQRRRRRGSLILTAEQMAAHEQRIAAETERVARDKERIEAERERAVERAKP